MEISEGVICLSLRPQQITPSSISILIILHTQPHSLIVNYYYYQRWHWLGIIKQMQLHVTLLSSAITPISFQL